MTFRKLLRKIERKTHDGCYQEEDFFDDFNEFARNLRTLSVDQGSGVRTNQKTKVYDIVSANGKKPGEYGFQGRYDLPDDIMGVPDVQMVVNGCSKRVDFSGQRGNLFFECSCVESCDCRDVCAETEIRLINNTIAISPMPTQGITKGLIIQYEAEYGDFDIDDMDTEIPFKKAMTDYICAFMINEILWEDDTQHSTTKYNRFFPKLARAQQVFEKAFGIRATKRVKIKIKSKPIRGRNKRRYG
jgi:hypothetical protein